MKIMYMHARSIRNKFDEIKKTGKKYSRKNAHSFDNGYLAK